MLTLAIDAATYEGTVAVVQGGRVLAQRAATMRGEHGERLMPAAASVLEDAGVDVSRLERIACGAGPGSFTSLRIAASIAKGLAVALRLPLVVAPSPLLIVAGAQPALSPGSYCAVLDAMRGDVSGVDVDLEAGGRFTPRGAAWLLPRAAAGERAAMQRARIVGPGEASPLAPHARGFAALLEQGLCHEVEIATWEPDYGRKAEAQVRWEQAHGRPLEAP